MFIYKILLSPGVMLSEGILDNYGSSGWELISVIKDENVVIRGARQIGTAYIYHMKKKEVAE